MIQNNSHIPEINKTKVWYNDGLINFEQANFHAMTHSLNYGTGVFEGVRVYNTPNGVSIFHLDDHLERLMQSVEKIGMTSPYTREQIKHACIETVRASGHTSGYIRPQLQFGLDTPGLGKIGKIDFFVFFWPLGAYRENPVLKVGLSQIERISPKSCDIEAKVVGYYTNSHFNYQFAHNAGWDDAIMLDVEGNIAEASSSNIFMVKDRILITPETGYILKGITRKTILEIAEKELGLKIQQRKISPDELKTADELFLTGTAAEIDPIGEYNDLKVGDGGVGNITGKLKKLYTQISSGQKDEYAHWHTFT